MEAKIWLPSIFIIGLFLRFYNLGKELWSDEVITYSRSYELFLPTNPSSSISPLYFVLSRLALEISSSDYVIRIPSAIAGSFVPVVMYFLVLRFFKSNTAACLSSLWIALSTYSVFLSQDARYYALLTLLFLAALYFLFNWFEYKSIFSLILYAVISGLALSCHLSYMPILISLNIGILIALFFQKYSYKQITRYSFVFLASSIITLITFAFIISFFGNIPTTLLITRIQNFVASESVSIESDAIDSSSEMSTDVAELPEFHSTSDKLYYLEYAQYKQYMELYFQELNLLYILPFIVVGLLTAFRYKSYSAIILLLCLVVVPCMGFFIPVNHWYSPRYLVLQIPIITILSSYGFTSIINYLFKKTGLAYKKTETFTFIIMIIFSALVLYFSFIPSLRSHYNHVQRQNFRTMAEHILPYLKTGDTIIHLWRPARTTSEWNYLSKMPLDFYLQYNSQDAHGLLTGISQMGLTTEQDVVNVVPNFKESNIWIIDSIHRSRTNRDAHHFTDAWKFVTKAGRDTLVWVVPKEYNNLVYDIGTYNNIEDLLSEPYVESFGSLPLELVQDKHNQTQIIMHSPEVEEGSTGIRFFVRPDIISIENPEFMRDERSEITGWSLTGETVYDANHGLKLIATEGTTSRISQVIDFRNLKQDSIRFNLNGYTNQAIVHAGFLCFSNDGIKVFSFKRDHSDGEFLETFNVPTSQFSIQSGILFVEVEAGELVLNNVSTERINPKNLLSSDPYILSVTLKSENIIQGDNPARVARINFTIHDEFGESTYFERLRLNGTSEYTNYRFFIYPGKNRVANNITRLHIDIGIYRGMGTLKLSSIQLERGTTPTYIGKFSSEPPY